MGVNFSETFGVKSPGILTFQLRMIVKGDRRLSGVGGNMRKRGTLIYLSF